MLKTEATPTGIDPDFVSRIRRPIWIRAVNQIVTSRLVGREAPFPASISVEQLMDRTREELASKGYPVSGTLDIGFASELAKDSTSPGVPDYSALPDDEQEIILDPSFYFRLPQHTVRRFFNRYIGLRNAFIDFAGLSDLEYQVNTVEMYGLRILLAEAAFMREAEGAGKDFAVHMYHNPSQAERMRAKQYGWAVAAEVARLLPPLSEVRSYITSSNRKAESEAALVGREVARLLEEKERLGKT